MPDQPTDEVLAEQTQKGDKRAFNELFARYKAKILRYGQRFLYNYQDLEDAVQDVFIKAYANIRSFDTQRSFSTWLYRIAHNTFINVIKKKGREPVSFFDFDTFFQLPNTSKHNPKTDLIATQEREVLQKVMLELAPKYREPLVLYYFEEKEYQEIADIMHIPISTVGVRLKRARDHMKKYLLSTPQYDSATTITTTNK